MEIVELYTENSTKRYACVNNRNVSIRRASDISSNKSPWSKRSSKQLGVWSNGSVYFDVLKYSKTHDYGKLSGRIIEDLIAGAGNERRELEGQEETQSRWFCLVEKKLHRNTSCVGLRLGDGFPGLAHWMFRDEYKISRWNIRYSWRRNGFVIPSPWKWNRSE